MPAIPPLLLPERKLVPKPWGGREVCRWVGIEAEGIGETWEVFDRGPGDSAPLRTPEVRGKTLRDLLELDAAALLGSAGLDGRGRFPLLLKLLDATDRLSLQVHPTDEVARALGLEEGGKSEAWVVLRAAPGARLIRGLAPGTTEADLFAALAAGRDPTPLLRSVPARAGDVLDIPAGTVHSIGAGLVLYEIQQNSDCTLRLHDWGRVDARGVSRPLHVAQGRLAVRPTATPATVLPRPEADGVDLLVDNDAFTLRRVELARPRTVATGGICHLLTACEGSWKVASSGAAVDLAPGETCIVAGWTHEVRLVPVLRPGATACRALWACPAAGRGSID